MTTERRGGRKSVVRAGGSSRPVASRVLAWDWRKSERTVSSLRMSHSVFIAEIRSQPRLWTRSRTVLVPRRGEATNSTRQLGI